MPIAPHVKEIMANSSFIRKMFEEGLQMKAVHGAENVYDFSIGNPDLEPPRKVKTFLAELAASDAKGLHAYMPNAGYPETRAAMAKKVSGEQGVALEASHVVMSVGAAGALNAVLKAVLSPGDEVVVPSPFFVEYAQYARNHGGVLKPVPTKDDFSLDTGAIEAALNPRVAAVIVNSPNNPTGKIYSADDIAALAHVLAASKKKTGREILLIADEPYRDIVYAGRAVSAIFPAYANAVVVTSFAKNLSLPGERIGYAAVNPAAPDVRDLVDGIIWATRVLGYVNAPATFQRVVAACWDEPVNYSSYEIRRNKLTAILDRAGIQYAVPEGAFYLFCKVPNRLGSPSVTCDDDVAFCDHLKKYRVLGVPGSGFGRKGWFRLAYCVPERSIDSSAESFASARKDWT